MNTITTDTTEHGDESGWSQTNNSLQKPYLYEKSFVDGAQVIQEGAGDSSVQHPVDEECTTNINKEYHLVSGEVTANELHTEDISTSSVNIDNNEHTTMQCGKGFATKDNLKRHLSIHTGRKLFSCQQCDYACADKSNLTKHVRIHTGERPFSCNHCDYTCAQKGDLKKHIRTHTGEKPFSCDVCGKLFGRSSHLKDHQLTHTGEKPYKCEHCGKSFGMKGNLTKHVRESCTALKM